MSFETAIIVQDLSKCYHIYQQPHDRLKQSIYPRLQRLARRQPKQYFREFWALQNVSFEIRKGETVGIIGRNGSGKSTLLQMICGTLNPTSGTLRANGRIAALLELGSGFNPEFTGQENIYLNAAVLGLTRREVEARYNDIVAFADIGEFIMQPVKTYSSGMIVRLAFAVMAHVDAEILVVDEALAVGDVFFTQKCMRFLRNFMKAGTVLFVSHDTSTVVGLCKRAIWLDKGRIVAFGFAKDLCEQYLEAVYAERHGQVLKSSATILEASSDNVEEAAKMPRDQRLDFINSSTLRNDLEIFSFDPTARSFGVGGASILEVALTDSRGQPFSWVIGGEMVVMQIIVTCLICVARPIIGFFVRDKLGQNLFGDNTFLTTVLNPVQAHPAKRLLALFRFRLPILPPGDYSVTVAVADGTQDNHLVLTWIHDAIILRSHSSSVSTGLIGIPMESVELIELD